MRYNAYASSGANYPQYGAQGGYGQNSYGGFGAGGYGPGWWGGTPEFLGGPFGYGGRGSYFSPWIDNIVTGGDVTLDPYEATSLWLFVHAGGSFTGVFEDETGIPNYYQYGRQSFNPNGLQSLWASANTTDVTFRAPNLPDGPVNFPFRFLREVSVDSKVPGSPEVGPEDDNQVVGTDLLFQNFGSDYFASLLQTIEAKAKASVKVEFDNYQQEDENGAGLDVFGDSFMWSLKSIRVMSHDENAKVEFSNDGGNDFMPSLQTISIKAKEFAGVSFSASVNTSPLPDNSLGNGFMRSLKTIHVISEEAEASVSVSYSGGADFMENLESIYISGAEFGGSGSFAMGASLTFSVSPDFNGTESVEFMRSLKTITMLAPTGEATMSISASGDILFMPSLESIFVKGVNHLGNASLSISHSVLVEDENVADFMPSLKTIKVIGENAGASLSISVETEAMYFQSLQEIYVAGEAISDLKIRNGAADDFAPLVTSLNVEMTKLRNDLDGEVPGAEIELRNSVRDFEFAETPGDNFMAGLQTIALSSIGFAKLRVENGLLQPFDPTLEIGGENYLANLQTVDVKAGLDADVILHSGGDNAFEALTAINIVTQQSDVLTPDEVIDILGLFFLNKPDRALSEIDINGEGATNAFGALEEINIKADGPGPLGLDDEGSITVKLDNIASTAFDVCLETNGKGDIVLEANDTPGLKVLALTGEDMASVLLTGAQTGFSLFNLADMAAGSEIIADMTGAAFGGGFEIRLGSGDLDYGANLVKETFVFTDAMLGTLNFSGFDTAPSGDLLDLSALGVNGLGELNLDDSGADLLISSTDGDFTGFIRLVGVDNAIDVTDNFIFT